MADLPPELDMDNFENIMASIDVGDLDVVDEVGGDESEEENERRKSREKDKRSSTRSIGSSRDRSHVSRNRSQSPRRYGRSRSRSRDRVRKRSPPKRKSPVKSRGAEDFLKDIQKEFGEFEGLQEVRSKVESHTILRDNRDRNRPGNRPPTVRPRQNNYQQQQPNNQYQNMNNGMTNQMMMNPMCSNPQMMGMMPNMMGTMIGPGPQMRMGFPMQMTGPGYNDGICPPGIDPGMGFNMQPQPPFIPSQPMMQQQQPVPMVLVPGPPANPGGFRNASPPTRNVEIEIGNISSRLLSQNKLNLSEYLETQASSGRGLSKTIEARPLRERILTKSKAALHRLNHAANDIQFELNFLHVPPAYSSDTTDAIGASPILPSKNNPVFRFSTKKVDAIQKCRPYPSVTRNIDPLIAQLGIDESVIARRLETNTRDRVEPSSHRPHINNFNAPKAVPAVLQIRPEMRDEICQTPTFACAKCDKRLDKLINTQTQTAVVERYAKSSQTLDTDFLLAKIRFKTSEKEQQRKLQNFKRDYAEAFSDDEDDKRGISPPRAPIGPPGYREKKEKTTATSSSSTNNDNATARKYYDRYYYGSKY